MEDDNDNDLFDKDWELIPPDANIPEEQRPFKTFKRKTKDKPFNTTNTPTLSNKEYGTLIKRLSDHHATTTSNTSGFCLIKASHYITSGTWYLEVKIVHGNENTDTEDSMSNPHVRVGWTTEKSDCRIPTGYDKHSYGYRDKTGERFHQSEGNAYGEPYNTGDVIGMLIHIPERLSPLPDPIRKVDRETVDGKVFEFITEKEVEEFAPEAYIEFFKNGKSQGIAFRNLQRDFFTPAFSLYMGGTVEVNFGPNFQFPPQKPFRPYSEANQVNLENPRKRPSSPPLQPPELKRRKVEEESNREEEDREEENMDLTE